jgi:hypothetical protein
MTIAVSMSRVLLALLLLTVWPGIEQVGDGARDQGDASVVLWTGSVVGFVEPWVRDDGIAVSGTDGEVVALTAGPYSLVIAHLPSEADRTEALDAFLRLFLSPFDQVEVVDRGAYGRVSYSLDVTFVEGVRMGIFTLFVDGQDGRFIEALSFMAPATHVAEGVASAQEHITIDGNPVLAGVDGAGLQSLLVPVLPVAATPGVALHELGVVEEGRYISPQFDVEVIWGDTWTIGQHMREPVFSNPTFEEDGIVLDWTGGALGMVGVTLFAARENDPGAVVRSWIDAAHGHGEIDVAVLLEKTSGTTTAALVLTTDPGGFEIAGVVEVACLDPACSILQMTEIIGSPEALAWAYADAQAHITIDSVPAFPMYSAHDVARALSP